LQRRLRALFQERYTAGTSFLSSRLARVFIRDQSLFRFAATNSALSMQYKSEAALIPKQRKFHTAAPQNTRWASKKFTPKAFAISGLENLCNGQSV
jgi:hypothetical protein